MDEKHLKVVKELKNYYYIEDIAAAAIQLCLERGVEVEEVRRRSLIHTHFIPLKTKESLAPRVRGKPKQVSQPAEAGKPVAHGTFRKPQHHPPKRPAQGGQQPEGGQQPARGQQPGRAQPGRSQQGAQPQNKPSGRGNQPGRGAGPQGQPKRPAQGGQQPARGQQPGRAQPGRSQGSRQQRPHGSPAHQGDRRKDQ